MNHGRSQQFSTFSHWWPPFGFNVQFRSKMVGAKIYHSHHFPCCWPSTTLTPQYNTSHRSYLGGSNLDHSWHSSEPCLSPWHIRRWFGLGGSNRGHSRGFPFFIPQNGSTPWWNISCQSKSARWRSIICGTFNPFSFWSSPPLMQFRTMILS